MYLGVYPAAVVSGEVATVVVVVGAADDGGGGGGWVEVMTGGGLDPQAGTAHGWLHTEILYANRCQVETYYFRY